MVVVPADSFMTGSPKNDPQQVTIAKPFAVARFVLTRLKFLTNLPFPSDWRPWRGRIRQIG
jgi:hypothetical protein